MDCVKWYEVEYRSKRSNTLKWFGRVDCIRDMQVDAETYESRFSIPEGSRPLGEMVW